MRLPILLLLLSFSCWGVQNITFPNANVFVSPSACVTAAGGMTCDMALWYMKFNITGETQISLTVDTTGNNGATSDQMPAVKTVAIRNAVGTHDTTYTVAQLPANNTAGTSITAISGLTSGFSYTIIIYGIAGDGTLSGCYNPGNICQTVIQSMQLSNGATLSAATLRPKTCVFFGDSYLLGYFGGAVTGAVYTHQDATWAWPFFAAAALKCEFSVFGIGSQGYVQTGNGGFPAINGSWNTHKTSSVRSFSGIDYAFDAEGLNDHGQTAGTITTNTTSLLAAQRAAFGATTQIFVVPPINPFPFTGDGVNGSVTADILAGVTAASDPLVFPVTLPSEFNNVAFVSNSSGSWCSTAGSGTDLHLNGGTQASLDGNCQGLIGYSVVAEVIKQAKATVLPLHGTVSIK